MTDDILCGVRRQTIQSLWHTGCPKKVAFTLLSHCCLLLILPAHDQQICSSETNRWKSKSKFLGNPVLQERTNEYHRKHIALYDITLKTSTNTEFGVFGCSWARIWARQIWSSGVSLKRSCKMLFRRVGLRSIGPSSQKLWPNKIFGWFLHCNEIVKLHTGGPGSFIGL